MKKIYLACPYTHSNIEIREMRFKKVNKIAGKLMKEGFIVLSPISHSHPIACEEDLPKNWEFWERQDRTFIDWADEVFVLCLNGWKESVGVQAEIQIAKEAEKPIRYLREEIFF